MGVRRQDRLPEVAVLARYRLAGHYVDSYVCDLDGRCAFDAYVFAFYTTWLFRLERLVLAHLCGYPSTDAQARELAQGLRDDFAAWKVETREEAQLLLTDVTGRTRSWLMVESPAGSATTRLHFGSAVLPLPTGHPRAGTLGIGFSALIGFHKLYSRALLSLAARRVVRLRPG